MKKSREKIFTVSFLRGLPLILAARTADEAAILAAAERIKKREPYGVREVRNGDGLEKIVDCYGVDDGFGLCKEFSFEEMKEKREKMMESMKRMDMEIEKSDLCVVYLSRNFGSAKHIDAVKVDKSLGWFDFFSWVSEGRGRRELKRWLEKYEGVGIGRRVKEENKEYVKIIVGWPGCAVHPEEKLSYEMGYMMLRINGFVAEKFDMVMFEKGLVEQGLKAKIEEEI